MLVLREKGGVSVSCSSPTWSLTPPSCFFCPDQLEGTQREGSVRQSPPQKPYNLTSQHAPLPARAKLAEVFEGGGQAGRGGLMGPSGVVLVEEDSGCAQIQVEGCAVGCCLRLLRPPDFSL